MEYEKRWSIQFSVRLQCKPLCHGNYETIAPCSLRCRGPVRTRRRGQQLKDKKVECTESHLWLDGQSYTTRTEANLTLLSRNHLCLSNSYFTIATVRHAPISSQNNSPQESFLYFFPFFGPGDWTKGFTHTKHVLWHYTVPCENSARCKLPCATCILWEIILESLVFSFGVKAKVLIRLGLVFVHHLAWLLFPLILL